MKILIVGSGGREHALTWALQRDEPTNDLFAAPGNPGMASLATLLPISATDIDGLISAVQTHSIDLTIVGPEVPLALGLADRLRERGKLVFGPSARAAQIEASKAYAKAMMQRAGVPTAASQTFTDLDQAIDYVRGHPEPLVVKASGLAGGKGAVVCASRDEAERTVRGMMEGGSLGAAGSEVVIEEFMDGEELSVFALTNGRDWILLPSAQDHKRLEEGDRGPNTGGMGAYSPVSIATSQLLGTIGRSIIQPTLARMEEEGARFNGLLYAGVMIGRTGEPRVVEFNCRFGDPETQAILPLLGPGLLGAMERVARNESPSAVPASPDAFAVTTVLAARGYPENPEKGASIHLPDSFGPGVTVFHAGTTMTPSGLAVAGGRVFGVTGVGPDFKQAQERSRAAADSIEYPGKVLRRDIGWREVVRTRNAG